MSYFFTQHFKTQLIANQGLLEGRKVKVVLFRYAPDMGAYNAAWVNSRTVAELVASSPGWVEVAGIGGYPFTLQLDIGTRTLGASRYAMFNSYDFSTLTAPANSVALGVVLIGDLAGVTDSLIFVSNSPLRDIVNVDSGDKLTANPDSTFPDSTNRWMFSWAVASPDPIEGPLAISLGSPDFEVSGSQHAWLYPQRVNFIANPSFEDTANPTPLYWSGNTALSRVSGGAPESGAWAGSVAAAQPGYLTPTVGTVSTPDPGPVPPAQCVWVFKVRGPTSGTSPAIVAQYGGSGGQSSWGVRRSASNGTIQFTVSTAGEGTGSSYSPSPVPPITGGDEWIAMSVDRSTTQTVRTYTSIDGASWQQLGIHTAGTFPAYFDTTAVVRVGSSPTFGTFDGRIYFAELRTGLDPTGGTVLWRFDANDYPGTGTVYTDPRGCVWTLTSGSAITPKTGVAPGYAIMESNVFSTQLGETFNEQWTIQAMVKGSGKLKVGLVYWDADYRATSVDWGDKEEWTLTSESWIHVATHRHAPEAHLAMVRFEVQGGSMTLDQVLAEPGYLKDWLYFDGDEKYGARDDFSWYGGSSRKGASYSLWYNHRKAVTGRLFARTVNPNDPSQNVTDEDMEEQGLVYRWVPAGITVIPHLDVLFPFDTQNPVATKPAGVLPYYSASVPDGVPSPWT